MRWRLTINPRSFTGPVRHCQDGGHGVPVSSGVGGGTHLKDEYDVPVGQNVYVQMDPLSTAGKTLAEAERIIKEKFDEIKKNLRDREQKPDSE